jgi:hypothetical protein
LQGGARFRAGRAFLNGARAGGLEPCGQIGRGDEAGEIGLGPLLLLGRLVAADAEPSLGFFERGNLGGDLRPLPVGGGGGLAHVGDGARGVALTQPRVGLGLRGGAELRLQSLVIALGRVGGGARGFRFAGQIAQPVLFGEASRGRRRRLGGLGEAVPTPQVAFLGDEPLAGLEAGAHLRAFAAQHEADLGQTPRQRRRRLDERRQRLHPGRQGRVAFRRSLRPMGGRGRVGRGVKIVAERRAERRLVAFGDADLLDHRRPQVAGLAVQQLRKRAEFGFEPLRLAFEFGERPASGLFGAARRRMRVFRAQRLIVGQRCGRDQHFELFGQFGAFVVVAGFGPQRVQFGLDAGEFALEAHEARGFLAHRIFKRKAPRVDVGQRRLRFVQRLFGGRQPGVGFLDAVFGRGGKFDAVGIRSHAMPRGRCRRRAGRRGGRAPPCARGRASPRRPAGRARGRDRCSAAPALAASSRRAGSWWAAMAWFFAASA